MRLLAAFTSLNLMCILCSPVTQFEVPPYNLTEVQESMDFSYQSFADTAGHDLEDYDYEDEPGDYDLVNPPQENMTDYSFATNDRARWSYAPGFIERKCLKKCKKEGKPFGRLLATKCTCFCPLNARELNLCATAGACDKFCASRGYAQGGDCVFNNVCFCTCGKKAEYNINQVYVAPAQEETTQMYNVLFYSHKKWGMS
ncbi:unnamed protein product [Orchesella dallaii]|uniref:Uncharacterized protein n=1 Tax=Orchesella dallaii TaxID=48710 RepID=A0ABP1QA08_9HEXA